MSFFKTKVRRIRFYWRLSTAYANKYKIRFLAILAFFVIIFISLTSIFPSISQKNVVNIGFIGNYTLDSIPSQILSLSTNSLISVDESGKPFPSLVSNWTISEDNKTYVLFLKENVKWHDGTDLDAREISVALSNVNLTAINSKALRFELENPLSSFLSALDKPVFKSKSFFGTGPEKIVNIDKIDNQVKKISLVPNDNNLPRVNLKFYPSEQQAINAFKIGEVKVLSVPDSSEIEKWPNIITEKKVDYGEIVTVFFNNEDSNLISKDLRQALYYAINRQNFDGVSAHSPLSQKSWAYNESIKRYNYNPSKAKELLTKAQISNPQLTLSFPPTFSKIAEHIKKDWETIGVKVALKEEAQAPKNFQAYIATNKIPPDPDQYTLWHSTQTSRSNLTKYKDFKIDKLLEDGRGTNDESKRKEYYFDFQRFLVEDAPAAFLYHPYKYRLIYKNIKLLYQKLPL